MLKKVLKFTDLNGEEQEKTLYFNYNKIEITRLQKKLGGDIQAKIAELQQSKDLNKIMEFIVNFIVRAYGEKSDDGLEFIKDRETQKKFENSILFDRFLDELMSNPEKEMTKFVKATANIK